MTEMSERMRRVHQTGAWPDPLHQFDTAFGNHLLDCWRCAEADEVAALEAERDELKAENERLRKTIRYASRVLGVKDTENERLREALERIVRAEDEAPVGMSDPAAIARAALTREEEIGERTGSVPEVPSRTS